MFKKCSIYSYMGLYLNEKELEEFEIQSATGIEIIHILKDYENVYSLDEDGMLSELQKSSLYSVLIGDGKYANFCYRIRNDSLILIPSIQIYYGIVKENGDILSCYTNQEERNQKLSQINQYGNVSCIVEDMVESKNTIDTMKHQEQLRKAYSILSMRI